MYRCAMGQDDRGWSMTLTNIGLAIDGGHGALRWVDVLKIFTVP